VAPLVVPLDPAATAVALADAIAGLDRARFDDLRLAQVLARAGFDDGAVRRTRLAIGLPHPATGAKPPALVAAWLGDPDVAAFLEIHDWDGRTYLNAERWSDLLEVATALDRVGGARRASSAIGKLRSGAATAGYDVERLRAALDADATTTARPKRRPRVRP
jgi:hypothetical protein